MTRPARLMPWFKEDPLPSTVPHPVVVLGGTRLLCEFLALAARVEGRMALGVAAPFVGHGIASELRAWAALRHDLIDLRLVTQSRRDAGVAEAELGEFPWRSLLIAVSARLHAKLYSMLPAAGGGACLVGSHNLTPGGARVNDEAGVLFVAARDAEVEQMVRACHDRIIDICRRGRVMSDSLRWPRNRVA